MCDRARLSSDVSEIKLVFRIPPERPSPNFAASWNVAPTDPLPVVRFDVKEHQRSLERNIELGILIRDRAFALTVGGYFQSLIDRNLLKPLPLT